MADLLTYLKQYPPRCHHGLTREGKALAQFKRAVGWGDPANRIAYLDALIDGVEWMPYVPLGHTGESWQTVIRECQALAEDLQVAHNILEA